MVIERSLKAFVLASIVSQASGFATPAAYGVGREGFESFRSTLPKDYNVVAEGGWHALQKRYVSEVGKEKFEKLKATLPKDIDVVKAGGYDNLMKLAVDPKAELVSLVLNNLKSTKGTGDFKNDEKFDALVSLLQAQGMGFSSVKVEGEWNPVLARQGKKSTKSQKFVGKASKNYASSFSNFSVKDMEFLNVSPTPRGNGKLQASVKYTPVAQNFDKSADGKIVLRRIACDITDASFKYWKLPKISFPFLKRTGGYLDFLYLDNDIRITRGNRGGLFVHFRPEFLEAAMN